MNRTTNGQARRVRRIPIEQEEQLLAAIVAGQQDLQRQQQQQQQQDLLWTRLPGLRPPVVRLVRLVEQIEQVDPHYLHQPVGTGAGISSPADRWERVPIGVKLMNEICDAASIDSDFAFWSGLIIVVAILIGLMVLYGD